MKSLHTMLINTFAKAVHAESYLEIGLSDPALNYDLIEVKNKECVDPYNVSILDTVLDEDKSKHIDEVLTYRMTSDEMFAAMPDDKMYDVVFIDGLHEGLQVYRDFINAYNHTNAGGVILLHDCMPSSEDRAQFPRVRPGAWYGTSWKAIPALKEFNEIDVPVLAMECGIGFFVKAPHLPEKLEMKCDSVDKYEFKDIKKLVRYVDRLG